MSIFEETFRPFVYKQLRIREAIVEKGNDISGGKGDGRFGNPRSDIEITPGVKEKLPLPAGAFFTNTTEKQCTIRMCSGVDLLEDNEILEDGDFENPKDLINEGLAIRYILEGGVPTKSWDFKSKRNLEVGAKYASIPRGDINKGNERETPNFGHSYGASYGDPYLRSEAKDGFGIVPMPGIIDANVRTKTAYGSLREAKVNFVCHNRRQLEIMELLYMRPGYPVCLEWGWTPYISNEGKKEEYFPYLSEFFKQDGKINDIQLQILSRKISSGGNYDGFIGYCKNFDIKSRPDGGYDCTTEIIAMGEVLEGLKSKNTSKVLKKENDTDIVDNLEYYLNSIKTFTKQTLPNLPPHLRYNEDMEAHIKERIALRRKNPLKELIRQHQRLSLDFIKLAKLFNDDLEITDYTEEQLTYIRNSEFTLTKDMNNPSNSNRYDLISTAKFIGGHSLFVKYMSQIEKVQKYLKKSLIKFGDPLGRLWDGYQKGPIHPPSQHAYIKWDLLTQILNNFVFPTTKGDKEPIVALTTVKDELGNPDPIKLKYSRNKYPLKFQSSKVQYYTAWKTDGLKPFKELVNSSLDAKVCLLPHQTWMFDKDNRNIGDILLNVEFLRSTYKDIKYNGDSIDKNHSLFDWLKAVWEGVNSATANAHSFVLQTELERPNIIRVIDMVYDAALQPKDLFEIKIQGNESIVRDFNFNTTLPSALGSTMAIAAQSPDSIDSLDAVTFSVFNKDIKYRFNQLDSSVNIKNLAASYDRDFNKMQRTLKKLASFNDFIISGYDDKEVTTSPKRAIQYVESLYPLVISLNSRAFIDIKDGSGNVLYPKGTYLPAKEINTPSSIIPLKFTAQMDGIGGIVIGNVFKVQKDRLPKGYQGDDIAFVVMTENQKITSGQDWTTDITGQLILLDIYRGASEESTDTTATDTTDTDTTATDTTATKADLFNLEIEKLGIEVWEFDNPWLDTFGWWVYNYKKETSLDTLDKKIKYLNTLQSQDFSEDEDDDVNDNPIYWEVHVMDMIWGTFDFYYINPVNDEEFFYTPGLFPGPLGASFDYYMLNYMTKTFTERVRYLITTHITDTSTLPSWIPNSVRKPLP